MHIILNHPRHVLDDADEHAEADDRASARLRAPVGPHVSAAEPTSEIGCSLIHVSSFCFALKRGLCSNPAQGGAPTK